MGSPTIAGKYSLLRKLGQGGMAEVYLARQEGLQGFQKLVVIKRILPHRAEDGEFVTMFLDEARTAADLRHPNVVNIFDINRDQGTYYMAMEFLHGHDVRAVMKEQAKTKESFPLEHALQIVMGAASGLDYAHKKLGLDGKPLAIIHRDVSPQNIIVGFSGEVKIVDFGIAKAASADTETEAGVVKGKFAYMAPEQTRGDKMDHRADQFALGAITWEILTLRRLFKRKTEHQTMIAVLEDPIPSIRMFRPDLPKELAAVVAKALERDPEKRFTDCAELCAALEELLANARVPHSQARLGEYLRKLFDESLESELELSAAQLDEDGNLVDKNESQPSLPPPDRTRQDRKGSEPKEPGVLDPTKVASKKKKSRSSEVEPPADPDAEETRTTTVPTPRVEERPRPPKVALAPPPQQPTLFARIRRSRAVKAALLAAGVVALLVGLGAGGFFAARSLEKGKVVVRSEPKGARIAVDGEPLAETTPHILRLSSGRAVDVGLDLAGYEREIVRVVVPRAGASAEVNVKLKKLR